MSPQHLAAWVDHRNVCIYCVDHDERGDAPLCCYFGGEQLLALVKGLPAPPIRPLPLPYKPIPNWKMGTISAAIGFILGLLLFTRW